MESVSPTEPFDTRRAVAVRVSATLFGDIFRERPSHQWFRPQYGLPVDAKLLRLWTDELRNEIVLVYEHESFRTVPPGNVVPNFVGEHGMGVMMECLCLDSFKSNDELQAFVESRKQVIIEEMPPTSPDMDPIAARDSILANRHGRSIIADESIHKALNRGGGLRIALGTCRGINLDSPNADETWEEFGSKATAEYCETGRCLLWGVPDIADKVAYLYVLPTADCQPVVHEAYHHGAWRVLDSGGGAAIIDYRQVMSFVNSRDTVGDAGGYLMPGSVTPEMTKADAGDEDAGPIIVGG